ncbi:MAG: EamA family transporter [Candidatus Micrarchaeota archaeon]|nr:EamA family transporter [Candidatus Micrarchaeota archaeon]
MVEWYYLILISSVLNGLATLVEKNALKTHYATEFSATVSPFVALISLLFIPLANFNISVWQLLLITAWSAINAYSYLLAARAFRHGELSASSAAFGSLPTLVVVVLAFLFLSEQLSLVQYIGIAGMIMATYMLFFREPKRPDGKQAFESSKYKYVVLLAVFVSGTASVFNKYAIGGVNPYTFFIISSISMALFFAVFISIRYRGVREIVQTARTYRLPISLASVLTSGYRLAFYLALVLVPVSLAQPLGNAFYVIITVAIGGLIFKEGNLRRKLALSAFLIFFAYLLTL